MTSVATQENSNTSRILEMKATTKLVECSEELREVISQINIRKEQEKLKKD